MEKIMYYNYPFNLERMMINEFVKKGRLSFEEIKDNQLVVYILRWLEYAEVLGYLRSELVEGPTPNSDSYRVYSITDKFVKELQENNEENERLQKNRIGIKKQLEMEKDRAKQTATTTGQQ